MLTPDPDARRMLVRERHLELARDALRPATPDADALERRIRLRRRISLPHLRHQPSPARDGTWTR